jgi:hypothetical protein
MQSTTQLVEAALPAFAAEEATDESVRQFLITHGVEQVLATAIVTFTPLAFSRAILKKLPLKLPSTYSRINAQGRVTSGFKLEEESVFVAAAALAQQIIANNQWRDDWHLTVAMWSPEFGAVNELLLNGSQPEDIELSPVIMLWDYTPTPSEVQPLIKPWWKFW